MRMSQHQALEVLSHHRGDALVVTTMSAVGIWPEFSDGPRDFAYMPSAMGQAPALGLGLALAQPQRRVIVVNGDGSLLMNLGCLTTLAAHPANVFLLIMDNGIYEVTGGQATAGQGRTDFAGLARAAGIPRVYAFSTLDAWRAGAQAALTGTGPVAIWLPVEARQGQKTPKPPRSLPEQLQRLRAELGVL